MIRCQVCQHEEYLGALYCRECGSPLANQEEVHHLPIQNTETAKSPFLSKEGIQVTLVLVDHQREFPLSDGEEFTIGRVSGKQPILPDIDLTAFQGYDFGVSRLHATIRIATNKVTVLDLGSSNGTRVNGEQIFPHQPHPLQDGDQLLFGKFKIQVRINRIHI